MRETDELLPTTAARIVDPPRSRPRALALTLAVALCAASAIAGVAIPRSSGDGVGAAASSLKAKPDADAAPPVIPAEVTSKSGHAVTKSGLVQKVDPAAWASECLQPFQLFDLHGYFSNHDLIGMPSGLCMDTMSCAFENCNVSGYSTGGALPALGTFDLATGDINELAKDNGIALNLPEGIAFPKSVADVVEAVKEPRLRAGRRLRRVPRAVGVGEHLPHLGRHRGGRRRRRKAGIGASAGQGRQGGLTTDVAARGSRGAPRRRGLGRGARNRLRGVVRPRKES